MLAVGIAAGLLKKLKEVEKRDGK
jgi:hypothetical protein